VHPDDRESERSAFLSALREPNRVHGWSFRLNGVDGVERVVRSSGRAILNEDGTLSEFVGVLSDITQASRLRVMAEDRALFAEQMVGIVSHDMRNPLSAIMTGMAVLRHGDELPSLKAKVLDSMVRSARRACELIDVLLDFTLARVGQGLPVVRKEVDFHDLIAHSVDELALTFAERSLEHVTVGNGTAFVDPHRIVQLLGNLVGNAMSYGMPERPVTVTSEVSTGWVMLSVHNHGDPIPAALMQSMFEPMVRGGPETPAVRSVGLGLFIVRAIVGAHHGRVSATSSRENGTRFVCHFPVSDLESSIKSSLAQRETSGPHDFTS
jgi:sigma-B regulation protein RsbU (phosphoserine phosphatase)